LISRLAEKIWKQHYVPIIGIEQVTYMLVKMCSNESLIHQMTNEGHVFYIGYDEDKAIAYASVSDKNGELFLHKFYVDTEQQSQGFGTKLAAIILQKYPHKKTIQLTVNRQNYKAINFYFKLGFKIERVADFDIGSGYFMNDG
jgi:ribosomal protein S18 acetylase RimI-like enzyme